MNIRNLLAASALVAALVVPTLSEAQVHHRGRTVVVRRGPVRVYRPARRFRVIRRPIVHRRRVIVVPGRRHFHHHY